MEEGTSETTRGMPSYVRLGDREIFSVDLRVGETTFVSWKKLMKDANKVGGSAKLPDPVPFIAHPNLEARIASVSPFFFVIYGQIFVLFNSMNCSFWIFN